MRIRFLPASIALLLFAAVSVFSSAAVAADSEPAQLVRDTFERSIDALQENQAAIRKDPKVAYDLMNQILAPHVDFELMSRLILARHWLEASPQQQERFVAVFRESLLRTYSKILSDNIDEAVRQVQSERQIIRLLPTVGPDNRGRVSVRTVLRFGNQDIPMEYRMYQRGGEWKVFDVLIENISFVMNYRSEYDAELQRGHLDTLIERIEERNRRAWIEKPAAAG
jgi:phospholipid transport system substrate-binding protein